MGAPLAPERFGVIVRVHWGIENVLHWGPDVTMNEDQLRNREGHGPENLALLRRPALNQAKLAPTKGSMRGKLKRAGWDETRLCNLLVQFKKSLNAIALGPECKTFPWQASAPFPLRGGACG